MLKHTSNTMSRMKKILPMVLKPLNWKGCPAITTAIAPVDIVQAKFDLAAVNIVSKPNICPPYHVKCESLSLRLA